MKRLASICCLVGVVATACADDGTPAARPDDTSSAVVVTTTTAESVPATPATAPASTAPPTAPPASSAPTTEPATTTTAPATTVPTTVGDPTVSVVEAGRFERPVDLVPRPGDGVLHVVQQRGQVVRWDRAGDGTTDVVLDLAGRLSDGGEQGLLGLAFSPDGGTAYVDFTDTSGTTTIAEYAVLDDGTFDVASERIVLTVPQPYGNHNAGDLLVDDDGLLYVTLGDGGSGGDPQRNGPDPTTLLGSLLRIDPRPTDDAAYSIPPDNPFADGPLELDDGTTIEGRPEVFAWGLRNPWKIAIDPITHDLWIADVGQNEIEEVDVVGPDGDRPAGWAHDFGWSAFEGTARFNTDVPDTGRTTPPVLTYRHGADGCSVSGGVPYRGTAVPGLEPAYVYSDYCSGVLWALDLAGARNLVLLDGFEGVTGVRADADGEVYVLESGGTIFQLVAG